MQMQNVKKVLRPLKAPSPLMDGLRTIADIDPNSYVVGQAIANNCRYQNVHCFNCFNSVVET